MISPLAIDRVVSESSFTRAVSRQRLDRSSSAAHNRASSMRAPPFFISCVFGAAIVAAQSADPKLQGELKILFPSATSFSSKEGTPPHFKAFVTGQGSSQQVVAGYAFWTTELEPLERGYHGPIKILVGMDTTGVLAGIIVVEEHEPYGDFSIEPPRFAMQFKGKNIRDPFKVGQDIDAVSRASITIESATRAVRNSARRMARQLLTPKSANE
jgi:NosR/NirI family nitrous oxide reductase transcriptional regulator